MCNVCVMVFMFVCSSDECACSSFCLCMRHRWCGGVSCVCVVVTIDTRVLSTAHKRGVAEALQGIHQREVYRAMYMYTVCARS